MGAPDPQARYQRLEASWARAAARFLPESALDSPWRHSAARLDDVPRQGWKLHLSATILTAGRLLRRAGPLLVARRIPFKGPSDLGFLDHLNAGLGGFSQVGKCLTVYCRDTEEAVMAAEELHAATVGIAHPDVPFDLPYRRPSCVYYRYGAFDDRTMASRRGGRVGAIVDPDGRVVPDRREPGFAVPKWMSDPFVEAGANAPESADSPLAVDYRAFDVLQQRGKGGVYRALDLTRAPARLCIIKEGLSHGETDPDGRDGRWRVRHEARVLRALRRAGIAVPAVIAEFDVGGGRYLVLEHLEGETLGALTGAGRPLAPERCAGLVAALRKLIEDIHATGWAWRDCKPENIVMTADGDLRPLDFEGACRLDAPAAAPWSTPRYRAPLPSPGTPFDPVREDLHAVEVIAGEIHAAAGLTPRPGEIILSAG